MAGGLSLKAAIRITVIPQMRSPGGVERRQLAQVHTNARAARASPAWLFRSLLPEVGGGEFRWEAVMRKASRGGAGARRGIIYGPAGPPQSKVSTGSCCP